MNNPKEGMYNLGIMSADRACPNFDDHFPDLNQFILNLVELFETGRIHSWDDLENLVDEFFTSSRMDEFESRLPGWKKMASCLDGITLVHVMCVFLGLFMLPEYKSMTASRQNLMKWIILFHDLEKDVEDRKRDPLHGFRSAATAAKRLPRFGFEAELEYPSLIETWSAYTASATTQPEDGSEVIQDNQKLPGILSGIDRLFGKDSPAALIIKTVLFHMSVNAVKDWPQSAPLSDAEIREYFDDELVSLLKVMMLADNEGWGLFYPDIRIRQRSETLDVFQRLEKTLPDF